MTLSQAKDFHIQKLPGELQHFIHNAPITATLSVSGNIRNPGLKILDSLPITRDDFSLIVQLSGVIQLVTGKSGLYNKEKASSTGFVMAKRRMEQLGCKNIWQSVVYFFYHFRAKSNVYFTTITLTNWVHIRYHISLFQLHYALIIIGMVYVTEDEVFPKPWYLFHKTIKKPRKHFCCQRRAPSAFGLIFIAEYKL